MGINGNPSTALCKSGHNWINAALLKLFFNRKISQFYRAGSIEQSITGYRAEVLDESRQYNI